MNTYQEFQNAASSEKVTLAILSGSKRLSGFSLVGANYELGNFDVAVLLSITINGAELVSKASAADLTENSYFNDRKNRKLLIKVPEGTTPNRSFVRATMKFFFSDKGISLPWDLQEGFEVYFEPQIKSTSHFGVELDVTNEETSAIEGSGSVTFHNDSDFWQKNFDSIYFENQIGEIYSWNPNLTASQAKLLFRGYIDSKDYSSRDIKASMKDLLYNLRSTFTLQSVGDLGMRSDPALASAKQRIIYGRLQGFRPVNLDKVLNKSYPLSGEATFFFNSTTVIGAGSQYQKEVVPNDKIVVAGVEYTVAKVPSDSLLELTQAFAGVNMTRRIEVVPSVNKSFINRLWLLSGHALSQPVFRLQQGTTTQRLVLDTTKDISDGDDLWIGEYPEGELVRVRQVVNGNTVTLATSTQIVYPVDTVVHRPCVQNVRMNDLKLTYKADYDCDPMSGRLILSEQAEANRAPLLESPERITVNTGDTFMQGDGASFSSYLKAGYKVRPQGTTDFYQVLSVENNKIHLTRPYLGDSIAGGGSLPQLMAVGGLAHYREKYQLRGAPVTQNLHGKFFRIYDSKGSVAIWFDIGNVGVDEPEHGCDRSIEITTLVAGDSQYVFVQKVKQKLELDAEEEFVCSIIGDILTIQSTSIGVRPPAKPADDIGFTVQNLSRAKQRMKVTGDVADSLDGQFVVVHDGAGTVAVWFDIDDSGTLEPSHGCDRAIEVSTVITDDDSEAVRDCIMDALAADGAWTVSAVGTDGLLLEGEMVSVSIGAISDGQSLTRIQDGKCLYDLHNKYFVLPYREGVSKTRLFFFDIGDEGASAPLVGADTYQEISGILPGDSEETFFESLAAAIEDDSTRWTADFSPSGVLITSEVEDSVGTQIDLGTAGLVIEVTQEGVAVNPFAGKILQYKSFVFGDSDVLSCDVYGKTLDGTITGALLTRAPEIVRDILEGAGSAGHIDYDSFAAASEVFAEELALSIPETFSDKAASLSYREVINRINSSVLGVLTQSNDFKLQYSKLKPSAKVVLRLDESDILDFSVDSSNTNMIRTAVVEYAEREYDYLTKGPLNSSASRESEVAQYILNTQKSKTVATYCQNIRDAERLAKRWVFILEKAENRITISTKLQAAQLQVNDVILVSHPKLYQRMGGESKVKIMMVEAVGKRGNGVEITAIDLSNAFNRVAKYTDTKQNWDGASDETRLLGGFYKDNEGLINGESGSFDTNLYW